MADRVFLERPKLHPRPVRERGKPAPVHWLNFEGEKYASSSRLERVRVLSFLWVTAASNRKHSRLEIWTLGSLERQGWGILGGRSANCGPNREMPLLPAFVPGGFICSSKRFGAAPFPPSRDQGKRAAQMGRPRAGIASNCVVIFRLVCGCVNGTKRAGYGVSNRSGSRLVFQIYCSASMPAALSSNCSARRTSSKRASKSSGRRRRFSAP
jgi:hypothetical protein